jgi:hypothetical protein
MSAYLLNGMVSRWDKGQVFDTCRSLIFYGAEQDAAIKAFEHALLRDNPGEEAATIKVEKIIAAPVLQQMLTERGPVPLDWPRLDEEVAQIVQATAVDVMDEGYWVDCNLWSGPDDVHTDIDSLQKDLPEEIRSGLNWSADKTYIFLLNVFRLVAAPDYPDEELEDESESPSAAEDDQLPARLAAFLEMSDKELALVVRARNSVVAAWLWKMHAGRGPLAANPIRVEPLCPTATAA